MEISKEWDEILKYEYKKEYYINLKNKINELRKEKIIYPQEEEVFKALELTPYKEIKIVILGQDPYPGENQAEGLAFSVKEGVPLPRSLKNIFKELKNDLNIEMPENGSLVKWAKQGILLLNTILTVEKGDPLSHKNIGWEIFTTEIIKKINEKETPVIFILWGLEAQKKIALIDETRHYIIKSSHPSPLSARHGFFGSKPFSTANKYLEKEKIRKIDFSL